MLSFYHDKSLKRLIYEKVLGKHAGGDARQAVLGMPLKARAYGKFAGAFFCAGDIRKSSRLRVEYYDVFLDSGTPLEPETMLKLTDRAGRILVLRPDVTTPIARIAATKLSSLNAPYRLFYVQNVFRSDTLHSGRNTETLQAGAELLGASGIRPDVEMIYARR